MGPAHGTHNFFKIVLPDRHLQANLLYLLELPHLAHKGTGRTRGYKGAHAKAPKRTMGVRAYFSCPRLDHGRSYRLEMRCWQVDHELKSLGPTRHFKYLAFFKTKMLRELPRSAPCGIVPVGVRRIDSSACLQ